MVELTPIVTEHTSAAYCTLMHLPQDTRAYVQVTDATNIFHDNHQPILEICEVKDLLGC